MGKPPSERRWTTSFGSFAVVAWSLAFETLIWLQQRGAISDAEAKKILVRARKTLDGLRSKAPHPAFNSAIEILDEHLRRWRPKRRK